MSVIGKYEGLHISIHRAHLKKIQINYIYIIIKVVNITNYTYRIGSLWKLKYEL